MTLKTSSDAMDTFIDVPPPAKLNSCNNDCLLPSHEGSHCGKNQFLSKKKEFGTCRICLGESELSNNMKLKGSNPLISPCKCSGSMKYVHKQCLEQWVKTRQGLQHNNESIYTCEVCHFKYFTRKRFRFAAFLSADPTIIVAFLGVLAFWIYVLGFIAIPIYNNNTSFFQGIGYGALHFLVGCGVIGFFGIIAFLVDIFSLTGSSSSNDNCNCCILPVVGLNSSDADACAVCCGILAVAMMIMGFFYVITKGFVVMYEAVKRSMLKFEDRVLNIY